MRKYFPLIPLLLLLACSHSGRLQKTTSPTSTIVTDGKVWAALFQQRAAEYRALCRQAYNIARLRIEEAVSKGGSRPLAIITDIDETLLDNSRYATAQALRGNDYDAASWARWTAKAEADTLDGALELFQFAASKNVEVYYITNREESERPGTMANLRNYRFPFADDSHLIMRKDVSSKESRRTAVAATHEIILLLGDNLADFSALFDKKSEEDRLSNVSLMKDEFGKKFIILPNTTYGGWEEAIYQYNYKLSPAQKDSVIVSLLR